MIRRFLAALAMATAFGGAALAQNALPTIVGPQGPVTAQPIASIGYDSVSGLACVVGKTATCAAPSAISMRSASTVTSATTSGTISTFTTALAASSTRRGCLIVNKSTNPMFVSLAASPTTANSVILSAGTATTDGGQFNCAGPGGLVVTDAVSVASGTASQAYLVISQ